MTKKMWYEPEFEGEDVTIENRLREYLQELIDLYCFDIFKVPEDITPDNLAQFLEIILRQYQYYNLSNLISIGEIFEFYFHRTYKDEFCDNFLPTYPNTDRRSIAMCILKECMIDNYWPILPEEVPFLIECLNVPEDEIIYIEEKLEKYFDQFDFIERGRNEFHKRWKVIKKQREEALANNQPLPIRPMGIELSLCYKEGFEPKE